uniref:Reverse transcriptase zinc-binding domain-containing protein n=1 Tax=Knipowitschia caucasica TaxID=637954 RepID=A0AAV2MGA0_KNICA
MEVKQEVMEVKQEVKQEVMEMKQKVKEVKQEVMEVKQEVMEEREPVSPVRGLAIGEPSEVWRNVDHPALPNRLRDLSWMVAHEVLPVRSVMHSRGLLQSATCPRPGCGAPESVRHLLWECSAAVDQWATAGSLQFPYLPAGEVLTAQLMLYGVGLSPNSKKDFTRIWLTLVATKDAIWTSRNLLVGRHMQIPPVAVIRMAAATVREAVALPSQAPAPGTVSWPAWFPAKDLIGPTFDNNNALKRNQSA